jgi:superoxide reductase
MATIGDKVQTADWKNEKHVPVIDCPNSVKAGEQFTINVAVGKAVAHPNTTEHYIGWINLYFQGEGEKFPVDLARSEFIAHGGHVDGANQGPAYSDPAVTCTVTLKKPGTLHAVSYCNIHGLWESTKEIKVS